MKRFALGVVSLVVALIPVTSSAADARPHDDKDRGGFHSQRIDWD